VDERPTPRGQASNPRKQKWAPRHYNRPEGFYSRLGKIGGSAPHNRPPGYYQRIGALGGGDHRKAEMAQPADGASHVEPPKPDPEVVRESREPVEPRGELTMREAGRRGGKKVAEKYGREFFRENGRKGGEAVVEKYGIEHYERLGRERWETNRGGLQKNGEERQA
jgi:general stress protein YciG